MNLIFSNDNKEWSKCVYEYSKGSLFIYKLSLSDYYMYNCWLFYFLSLVFEEFFFLFLKIIISLGK